MGRRGPRYAALVCAAALLAVEAAGGEELPPYWPEIEKKLQRRVSFEFQETPAGEAIQFLNSLCKVSIILDPDACKDALDKRTITLKVTDMPMHEALRLLLDQAGLEFRPGWRSAIEIVKKGAPWREHLKPIVPVAEWEKALHQALQKKITAEFVDTPLDETIAFLQATAVVNILIDPALLSGQDDEAGPLTNLRLQDTTVEKALMTIMACHELNYTLRDEALFLRKGGQVLPAKVEPLTAAQEAALGQAVAKLNADDFDTRETASKTIAALGLAAAPALRETARTTQAPEVRARIENLLRTLAPPTIFDEAPEVTAALAQLQRRVSFEFVDTPLEEAANFLVSLCKIKMAASPAVAETAASLRVTNMQLANAIRWIARLSGTKLITKDGELLFVKRAE
jgi:hypothetical protein